VFPPRRTGSPAKKAGTLKQTSGKSYRVVGQKTQQRRTINSLPALLISAKLKILPFHLKFGKIQPNSLARKTQLHSPFAIA